MITGNLRKMATALLEDGTIEYHFRIGTEKVRVNDFIGKPLRLHFTGVINCKRCGRKTKKSFAQGFCYPCFMNAPENSPCIIKPELCEAHEGKGRDVEWEKANHLQPHVVYLALTSKLKVGVTRGNQIPTRWIDQGAWRVILVSEVPYRRLAGDIEIFLKNHLTDKTSWQRMLKNERDESIDIQAEQKRVQALLPENFQQYNSANDAITELNFPVLAYPTKVKSLNFDKTPTVEGTLQGIKGQYLIFDGGRVLNIRKFAGYAVELGE